MKKIFFLFAVALLSISAFAIDGLNIMASGIKGAVNDDVTKMEVEYTLNTDATALEIEFFDVDQELVSLVEIKDANLLTAGTHKTTIDLPIDELYASAYKWSIQAYGATTVFKNLISPDDVKYKYYMPRDVLVDNSFESDYFGRVYVSMATVGNADNDAGSETTKNQTRGIYIYDSELNFVNGQQEALVGYDGNIGGDDSSTVAFRRLTIDEQGYVYVCSLDEQTKGVYRMDPADPTKDFVKVLAANAPVAALDAADGKLYTLEGIGTDASKFNAYDLATVPFGEPAKSIEIMENGLANSHITLRSDKRGGFWVVQYRGQFDEWIPFAHWTKKGKIDYRISKDENRDLLAESLTTQRGSMAVSIDGDLVAIGSDKRAVVFNVAFDDETGVPSLTKLCETPQLGTNIDGLAFDAADNLYIVSASSEKFYVFPLAKEEGSNHCRVFAPSKYGFEIGTEPATIEQLYITGNIVGNVWNAEEPIEMTAKGEQVFETTATFEAADLAYFALATEKGSWDAFNGSRFGATPNNATVTADAPVALTSGGDGACITIAPGTYNIKADMAAMQLSVEVINAIDSTHPQRTPAKRLTNGQIIIIRDGIQYNLLGTQLK